MYPRRTVTDLAADLRALHSALASELRLAEALHTRWRYSARRTDFDPELAELADRVDDGLRNVGDNEAVIRASLDEAAGGLVFSWCAAHVDDPEALMADLLKLAITHDGHKRRARIAARNRVIQGPLEDALGCIPLLGNGQELNDPTIVEAFARVEILVWEAGARALQLPELGEWIWGDATNFEAVVAAPARGSLRGRVLAARCLEIAVCGISPMCDQHLVGRTLQVMQPLLLHPEPIVWVHAARAFGRLAGVFEPLEGTLLDWVHGGSQVLRQRALTAFASLPKQRLAFLGHELESILDSPTEKAWGLAAAAAATPYLFSSRRRVWDTLCARILDGDGGSVAARALGRGIATLWRRGGDHSEYLTIFRRLRRMAQRAPSQEELDIDDARRWLELIALTDPIDQAERDPLDIETGLENLVRLASRYDDEEADARAARFAATLLPTFTEAARLVLSDGNVRRQAGAINAFEGCARSLSLRLWGPMLATRPGGETVPEPDLEETWASLARAPAEILEAVQQRREEGGDPARIAALEVLALKLGGYALDACGEEHHLGPGRGETAHETCLWLRRLDGLDGSRELASNVQAALSALFWRLVDTTRGTALGEIDDVAWLGPFAAWWALVIDRPVILQTLASALPMIEDGALETCCRLAEETQAALAGDKDAADWQPEVTRLMTALHADQTELGASLSALAGALTGFSGASGARPDLEPLCMELVLAGERLKSALHDPVRALHPARTSLDDDSLDAEASKNAPRLANVVARAIRARDLTLLEVWFASLGPTAASLVEAAVESAVRRTPPPPPRPQKAEPKTILGYELIKRLGEGGIGSVWLVRKPGADRYFVLKVPKSDVLASASDTEREGILASFTEEASALAGLYHPNVANIIDRGVTDGMPYLVLEYLIGADLKMYSDARKMTLYELRRVVHESCAGLTALHNAELVHRDVKPANIWLRLPLGGGVRFDPEIHRDPAVAQPLSTVLIDFGMVRKMRVPPEVGGRFVAGTPGYIAPEQVLDPVDLDARADVYALAGTIYNVMTGRTFFDEIEDKRERIVAHMRRDPLEDISILDGLPSGLARLLRAGTARDFRDRPSPLEFGHEFLTLG